LSLAKEMIEKMDENIKFSFGYMKEENGVETYVSYDDDKKAELIEKISTDYTIMRFRRSDEVYEPFSLIKTFVDNAVNHCYDTKISIKLVEDLNGDVFNLIVDNTANKIRTSKKSNHITLNALKYIFGDDIEIYSPDLGKENPIFEVVIRNFIIKKGVNLWENM